MVKTNKLSKIWVQLFVGTILVVFASSCDNKVSQNEESQPKYVYGEKLKHPVINYATITKDSVANYERLAAKGNAEAMFMLANCYDRGIYCTQDSMKAITFLRKAAVAGDYDAQMLMCEAHFDWTVRVYNIWANNGYDRLDYSNQRNVEQTRELAEKGQAWAQVLVGCYYNDLHYYPEVKIEGYETNKKKAKEWYKKASDQGFAWGQYAYAECLRDANDITEYDYYNLMRRASNQGCYPAFSKLLEDNIYSKYFGKDEFESLTNYYFPIFYNDTITGKHANPDSVDTYQTFANQGDSEALFKLGLCYEEGISVERDYDKSWKFIRESANKGNPRASLHLGSNYRVGETKLYYWYNSAMQGNKYALANLGKYFAEEENVELAKYFFNKAYSLDSTEMKLNRFIGWVIYDHQDATYASKFLARAVDLGCGDPIIMYKLAQCYYNGWGGIKDYKLAMKYFLGAEEKVPIAKTYLGLCCENGQGTDIDYESAIKWYHKAEEKKEKLACYRLGLCYEYGRGVKQDMGKAAEYYLKAAKYEDQYRKKEFNLNPPDSAIIDAYLRLSRCYANGEGVEKDTIIAKGWYSKADLNNYKRRLYGFKDQEDREEISSFGAFKKGIEAICFTPRQWATAKSYFFLWLKTANFFVLLFLSILLCWGLIKLLKHLIKPQNSFVNKTRRVVFEDGNDETWYFSSNHCLLITDKNGKVTEYKYKREKNGTLRIDNYHDKDIQLISFNNSQENPKVKGNKLKSFIRLIMTGSEDSAYMFKYTEENSQLKYGEIKKELEFKQYIEDVWKRWLNRNNWFFKAYGERDNWWAIIPLVGLLIPLFNTLQYYMNHTQDKGALLGVLFYCLLIFLVAFTLYSSILGRKIEKRIRTRHNQEMNEMRHEEKNESNVSQ